jgi:hypothetical protein
MDQIINKSEQSLLRMTDGIDFGNNRILGILLFNYWSGSFLFSRLFVPL